MADYAGAYGVAVVTPSPHFSTGRGGPMRGIIQSWGSEWGRNRNLGSNIRNKELARMSQREYTLMKLGQWGAQNIINRRKAGIPVPKRHTSEHFGRYTSGAEMSASGVVSRMVAKTLAGVEMMEASKQAQMETRYGMQYYRAVKGQATAKQQREARGAPTVSQAQAAAKALAAAKAEAEKKDTMIVGGAVVLRSMVGKDTVSDDGYVTGTGVGTSTKPQKVWKRTSGDGKVQTVREVQDPTTGEIIQVDEEGKRVFPVDYINEGQVSQARYTPGIEELAPVTKPKRPYRPKQPIRRTSQTPGVQHNRPNNQIQDPELSQAVDRVQQEPVNVERGSGIPRESQINQTPPPQRTSFYSVKNMKSKSRERF